MDKVAVIGAGHVGLVTASTFAEKGKTVICVDNDHGKIAQIKTGKLPFYEPGLDELVKRHFEKNLYFTTSIAEAVKKSEFIFICVGTPPKKNGEADLSSVERVGRAIGEHLDGYKIVVEKSTVPVETGKWLRKTIAVRSGKTIFDVACNPEFLREGSAVHDALFPDRIVLGLTSEKARKKFEHFYKDFDCPKVFCDLQTAELIKHASNAFLSMKISFINMISLLCDQVGADVEKVAEGMGLDPRIGHAFLQAGIGFGGFCFPKDLQAFTHMAAKAGVRFELLKEVMRINNKMKEVFLEKLKKKIWILKDKTIAVWGLSFKPNTDDMRFAPSVDIIKDLVKHGACVRAFDPQAHHEAKKVLPQSVVFCRSPLDAAEGTEALLLLTEWECFKRANLKKVKQKMNPPYILGDGRNLFDPEKARKLGFDYFCMGRA